jgi:hypothetical protein
MSVARAFYGLPIPKVVVSEVNKIEWLRGNDFTFRYQNQTG